MENRKLGLRREAIGELSTEDLAAVVGAGGVRREASLPDPQCVTVLTTTTGSLVCP
jgi:hypothetical protein